MIGVSLIRLTQEEEAHSHLDRKVDIRQQVFGASNPRRAVTLAADSFTPSQSRFAECLSKSICQRPLRRDLTFSLLHFATRYDTQGFSTSKQLAFLVEWPYSASRRSLDWKIRDTLSMP